MIISGIMETRGENMSNKYISDILFLNKLDENSYLNDLPVIKFLSKERQLTFSSNVTFFVGENGTGKTPAGMTIRINY